ncbi:MAG TPA: nucleotidyltransferase family protein [Anaerolineales bacterium]|nr:nucleotidyltransferase family protein [Anaerolineales bacterium]
MDAVVTAGGIPQPDDPLYDYTRGESKAMVDVAGKPMIQWTLDALSGAKNVENVIVTGLSPKSSLKCRKPIHYLSNQGRMLDNLIAGVNKSLELNPKNRYVLLVSSDIPALQAEMVDWLIQTCMETSDDIYYGVCPREVMEMRYPGSKRTYTKLKDMEVCGSDINVTHVRMASEHLDVWEALIANRKNPVAQARVMGVDTLYLLLTRQATLQDFVERVSKKIGVKGRAIVWPYAEPCMDVDKPSQLEMMRADLAKRAKAAPPKASARKKPAASPRKKAAAKKPARPARKRVAARKSAGRPKAKKK